MKYRVDGCIVLPRAVGGPLADQLAPFAQWLDGQGYAPYSSYRKILLASAFSWWLQSRCVSLEELASKHTTQYLRHRSRQRTVRSEDAFSLRQLLSHLRGRAVIREDVAPARRSSSLQRCLTEFECHLRDERALAPTTIVNYVVYARALLVERYSNKRFCLARLCAQDVVGFVQRRAIAMNAKRAKLMTTALRSFVQYLHCRGSVPRDLTDAIPTVAAWTMSSVPRAIPAAATQQLLASVDRRTALGRRDYAILLLFARLGLRLSEVMRLELGDIDWSAGSVSYRGKGDQRGTVPLPDEVGKAIAEYLQHGRPRCACRRVFVRHRAPVGGFRSPTGIDSVIRHCIQRAGVETPSYGAHQFRHALATQLLRGGASLEEIGDLLGHRSLETTRIYAKVDIDALRTLATPWPGGVR